MACSICRRRKSKCDGQKPCGECRRFGRKCEYEEARKRGPKRREAADPQVNIAHADVSSVNHGNSHASTPQDYSPAEQVTNNTDLNACASFWNVEESAIDLSTLDAEYVPFGFDSSGSESWDLMDLGRTERLPSQEVTNRL